MKKEFLHGRFLDDRGAVAIFVAVVLTVLLLFTALAVDLGHVFVVRNELHNAADAGALAGARALYLSTGASVNTDANERAADVATLNKSERALVEVNPAGDVERGHWSFNAGSFTPNNSTAPPDLAKTTAELDADINFINACRVTARRESVPAASFFAQLFGYRSFAINKTAVAYIGFAGELAPHDVDQPMAICKQSIQDANGAYSCATGRMLNSGSNTATHNTAGWTNFSQPCKTASASDLNKLICGQGNPATLSLGGSIGASGGTDNSVLRSLITCWMSAGLSNDTINNNGYPTKKWSMTLPVVDCPGNNVPNCATLVGAVQINLLWMLNKEDDPAPRMMEGWTCPGGFTDSQCWTSFATHFALKDADGNTAAKAKMSMYYQPDCSPHELKGRTGGHNFGVLAKIPVLVQ